MAAGLPGARGSGEVARIGFDCGAGALPVHSATLDGAADAPELEASDRPQSKPSASVVASLAVAEATAATVGAVAVVAVGRMGVAT